MKQLNLFHSSGIRVNVYRVGDHYSALIGDGWWIASGKTPRDAFKRVIKRYEREMGYA